MSGQGPAPRLTIRGAKKRFGGVRALDGVDLTVAPGEIHALLGENGAGKSTLMRVLAGVIAPDAGELALDGATYAPRAPRDARERGIAMIHQELNLCPELTVLDNVTLGAESTRFGVLDRKTSAARLAEVLEALGVTTFGPRTLVRDLGPGDRQLVEIARALMFDASLIVFDEPTSSLSRPDVERLFDVARGLRDRGVSIVWISHFLDEVEALCDRFTVLRDGVTVGDGDVAGTPKEAMVARMVGRPLEDIYPDGQRKPGDVCLRVEGLKGRRAPESASFELRRGEILGVFGLVGAGRTEMLRVLFGLDARVDGTIEHKGERILRPTPRAWVQRGVGLLSEDRAHEGLAVGLSLAENAVLSSLESLSGRGGSLSPASKTRAFDPWRTELGIRCDGPDQSASELSGGNQQKVAIARLLQSGADVLLLDEPTRGIDVGAKVEVYRLLDALARKGHAILVVSSHIPELLGIADRIACMNRGVLTPARPRSECTEPSVLQDALATR